MSGYSFHGTQFIPQILSSCLWRPKRQRGDVWGSSWVTSENTLYYLYFYILFLSFYYLASQETTVKQLGICCDPRTDYQKQSRSRFKINISFVRIQHFRSSSTPALIIFSTGFWHCCQADNDDSAFSFTLLFQLVLSIRASGTLHGDYLMIIELAFYGTIVIYRLRQHSSLERNVYRQWHIGAFHKLSTQIGLPVYLISHLSSMTIYTEIQGRKECL